MWNRPSKRLWVTAAFVVLSSPAALIAQAGQPQYKDPAEFTLYDSILKDTTPKTRLEKLQEWQTKYPATDFEKQRKTLFLTTYVALNDAKNVAEEAKRILADDPKDFTSLYYTMYFTRALAGNNPTPEVLDQGEKAATAILANIDTPPPNVTADQWKGARAGVETLGHATLGWIAMQRKSWDAAEGEFQKTLALDPASGEVEYFMGTVIANEKKADKTAELFYLAKAASNDGPETLPAAGRQQVLDYVKRSYKQYHGSDEGFNELLAQAKSQPTPPNHIKSGKEIQEEKDKADAIAAASHPELTLWKTLKTSLTSPDGANYFSTSMKDAMVPTLKGKVVRLDPEIKPKTLVLALEDGTTPDATLKFEMPLPGKVDPGTELSFEGVAQSYTAAPFMLVFDVDPNNLHGWTGKNAAPVHHAPVHKKASASK